MATSHLAHRSLDGVTQENLVYALLTTLAVQWSLYYMPGSIDAVAGVCAYQVGNLKHCHLWRYSVRKAMITLTEGCEEPGA